MKKTPLLHLSLQWAHPKAQAVHRAQISRHIVERAIKHALKHGIQGLPANVQTVEITVRIVDTEEGRVLNHQYRAKDYATNVLTFDYARFPVLSADIVLCAPILDKEALEQHKEIQAHYVHLLVHGTLHALGYDHEHSRSEAACMEALEVLILQGMGYKNPYEA